MSCRGLAAIGDGQGNFILDEVVVRAPERGEIRVRLVAAGLCHTDHASLRWSGPLVLGHEGAGIVDAVPSGENLFRPGQRVLLNWAIPCSQCPQCLRGNGALCERTHQTTSDWGSSHPGYGHTLWRNQPIDRSFGLGTFANYTLVRREALTPLPDALPLDQACILGCAVMTGVGSVINVAHVQKGDSVAVIGCGGVGLSAIQGAVLAGADKIIAIDRRPVSLERACSLGATRRIIVAETDTDHRQLISDVLALTSGRGADHVFEATGVHKLAFLPLRLVRNGGNAVQLSGAHGEVSVPMPWFMWEKRYFTPLYGGCVPERDFPRLLHWVERGSLKIGSMIGARYKLTELDQAMAHMLAGGSAKTVIDLEG